MGETQVSALASALRRAGALLVEPPPEAAPAREVRLEVVVTALAAGAGARTVARGLTLALRRSCPVELIEAGDSGAVAAGPGIAVVQSVPPAESGGLHHRGPGRVLVAAADGRREPPIAALVRDVLAARHERVVLVANRTRDVTAWRERGAVCVPDSRLGAWLLQRGRWPPGGMGVAFEALAVQVREAR